MVRNLFPLALFLFGCAAPQPRLIVIPKPVGDGGKILRDLYRSFWTPPGNQRDLISIGIIPSQPSVRFRTLKQTRIRAMGEESAWEVLSPPGMTWKVEGEELIRPAVQTYIPSVRQILLGVNRTPPSEDSARWQSRGFPNSKWMGPPATDLLKPSRKIERWALALDSKPTEEEARQVCQGARKFKTSCQVLGRIEIPPIAKGRLISERGHFQKDFTGVLELDSPSPIEVMNVPIEPLRSVVSNEKYAPRILIIPRADKNVTLVQWTTFQQYLEGVVPAEIFASAPLEALKAQAIVARTYAARENHIRFSDEPYLICGSTMCQVYRGQDYRRPSTSEAVIQTADLVLWDQEGKLAETYFHSLCGGHTEPKDAIWGLPRIAHLRGSSDGRSLNVMPLFTDKRVEQYLNSSPETFCGSSKWTQPEKWRWSRTLQASDINELLSKVGLAPPLKQIQIIKRGISGRALELKMMTPRGSKTIQGELKIREILSGLLSSLMLLEPHQKNGIIDSITIRGAGYGHGVGMCQVGAIGRAESGQSASEILQAYYPGAYLATFEQGMLK